MEKKAIESLLANYKIVFTPSSESFFLILLFLNLTILNLILLKNSSSCQTLQFSFNMLTLMWALWPRTKKPRIARNADDDEDVDHKLPQETEMMTEKPGAKALTQEPSSLEGVRDEGLTLGEVAAVMGKLGVAYDPAGDKLQERIVHSDIVSLFDEQEPSIQEVEAAFAMFDENHDGFIDAAELRKVLSTLFLTQVSEADCKKMIVAKDENGDGLIGFHEFERLLAESFT